MKFGGEKEKIDAFKITLLFLSKKGFISPENFFFSFLNLYCWDNNSIKHLNKIRLRISKLKYIKYVYFKS